MVEEAPAPGIGPALREQITDAAISLARAVNYCSAGTVEFLLDRNGSFYFLEMNTRIQVEHPITEMLTGIDLVHWQLRVAAGESLPLVQDEIPRRGHALECRIYAEDPAKGFLPSTGRLLVVEEPGGGGVRVDSGVSRGDEVSAFYDPMLAKVVTQGATREESIARMERALAEYVILGVTTNIPFLLDVLRHPAFRAGDTTTDFIARHMEPWAPSVEGGELEALIAASMFEELRPRPRGGAGGERRQGDPHSPWADLGGWGR